MSQATFFVEPESKEGRTVRDDTRSEKNLDGGRNYQAGILSSNGKQETEAKQRGRAKKERRKGNDPPTVCLRLTHPARQRLFSFNKRTRAEI